MADAPNPSKWRQSARFGRTDTKTKKPMSQASVVIWLAVGCVCLCTLCGGLIWQSLSRGQDAPAAADTQAPLGTVSALTFATDAPVTYVTPEPRAGLSRETALDLSASAFLLETSQENLNYPGIYWNEVVYSAGTGPARLPVLTKLYLYDLQTGTETELAKTLLKNGEIFEAHVNQRWVVYIDTNQTGSNRICFLDRYTEKPEVALIKETKYALPKLRLYDDYLIWIEQTEEKTDEINFFDLSTGEDFAVTTLTEDTTYGVSAPSIYGDEIIWAGPSASGDAEKSAIYYCEISRLSEDDYVYETWEADMYVHQPLTNGEAWVWIDKNKAPDSNLYLKYRNGSNVQLVATGVTGYCLGEDIVVYAKDMQIWCYFYKEGIHARLSAADGAGMQPAVFGRTVIWYDLSGEDISVDKFMVNDAYLPGETPIATPTIKPDPTPTPSLDPIVITDLEAVNTPNPNP